MGQKSENSLVQNRRAFRDYEIIESHETGIVLKGTEIKSLRDSGGSLQESYVQIKNNELWLVGAHIAPYNFGNINNHEETRERKLLMHKREISKLKAAVQEKGLALVPLALYLKRGRVKVKIALARGKKNIDKRATIKEREEKRRMQHVMKNFR